jgi:hypothetical protein
MPLSGDLKPCPRVIVSEDARPGGQVDIAVIALGEVDQPLWSAGIQTSERRASQWRANTLGRLRDWSVAHGYEPITDFELRLNQGIDVRARLVPALYGPVPPWGGV